MEHSPEPWTYEGGGTLADKDDVTICYFTGEWGEDVLQKEDAERIVACVNAMKDVPDPESFMRACKELLRNHSGGGIMPPDSRTYISRLAEHIDIELPV